MEHVRNVPVECHCLASPTLSLPRFYFVNSISWHNVVFKYCTENGKHNLCHAFLTLRTGSYCPGLVESVWDCFLWLVNTLLWKLWICVYSSEGCLWLCFSFTDIQFIWTCACGGWWLRSELRHPVATWVSQRADDSLGKSPCLLSWWPGFRYGLSSDLTYICCGLCTLLNTNVCTHTQKYK